jgi:hypothetical protein
MIFRWGSPSIDPYHTKNFHFEYRMVPLVKRLSIIVLVYLNDTIGISTINITYIWHSWPSIKWYRKSDHRIKPSWPLYLTYILYRLNSWPLDRLNGTYITIVFISHEQIAHNWVYHILRHIHISTLIYYLWDMYKKSTDIYCLDIYYLIYFETYPHIYILY